MVIYRSPVQVGCYRKVRSWFRCFRPFWRKLAMFWIFYLAGIQFYDHAHFCTFVNLTNFIFQDTDFPDHIKRRSILALVGVGKGFRVVSQLFFDLRANNCLRSTALRIQFWKFGFSTVTWDSTLKLCFRGRRIVWWCLFCDLSNLYRDNDHTHFLTVGKFRFLIDTKICSVSWTNLGSEPRHFHPNRSNINVNFIFRQTFTYRWRRHPFFCWNSARILI